MMQLQTPTVTVRMFVSTRVCHEKMDMHYTDVLKRIVQDAVILKEKHQLSQFLFGITMSLNYRIVKEVVIPKENCES